MVGATQPTSDDVVDDAPLRLSAPDACMPVPVLDVLPKGSVRWNLSETQTPANAGRLPDAPQVVDPRVRGVPVEKAGRGDGP